MKKKVDIDNRRNLDFITIDTISPCNYNPKPEKVKRFAGAFTLKGRFKRAEEHQLEKRSGPGPQVYTIEDNIVKQTRYNNVLVGGHAPKDSLMIDKNPGPGTYDPPNTIANISIKKSKYSKTSLLNKTGSFLSQSTSMISSPRECAFSVPLMGDPFNPVGFIKSPTSSYGRRDMALLQSLPGTLAGDSQEKQFINKFIPHTARTSTRASGLNGTQPVS